MEKEPESRKPLLDAAQKRRLLKRSKALTALDLGSSKTSVMFQSVPEMETLDLKEDPDKVEGAYPSLPDNVLKLLGLFGKREPNKNLNEPDIEEKFARLSLAFKTDKFTLSKRLDLQQRQRDIAEKNIECELKSLRESLNALNQLCTDSDMREVITKTQQHVDIVQQTTMRMSSRAETYGAIQQEQRMNSAFETMLSYVEHLKLLYDKEHMELEEYRRLLAEHNLLPDEKGASDNSEDNKRMLPPRSHSLSSSSKPEGRTRLLSAVCLLNPDSPFQVGGNSSLVSPSLSPKSRRASMPVGPLSSGGPAPASSKPDLPVLDRPKREEPEPPRAKDIVKQASTELPSSEAKDHGCDICQEISSLPCVSDCHATNKSSSRQLITSSLFDDPVDAVPSSGLAPLLTPQATSDPDEALATKHCSSISLMSVFRWTIDQGIWCFNGRSLMLRCRFAVSAILATAAMLSLVLTFLPNIIEFASMYL